MEEIGVFHEPRLTFSAALFLQKTPGQWRRGAWPWGGCDHYAPARQFEKTSWMKSSLNSMISTHDFFMSLTDLILNLTNTQSFVSGITWNHKFHPELAGSACLASFRGSSRCLNRSFRHRSDRGRFVRGRSEPSLSWKTLKVDGPKVWSLHNSFRFSFTENNIAQLWDNYGIAEACWFSMIVCPLIRSGLLRDVNAWPQATCHRFAWSGMLVEVTNLAVTKPTPTLHLKDP